MRVALFRAACALPLLDSEGELDELAGARRQTCGIDFDSGTGRAPVDLDQLGDEPRVPLTE